MAILHIELEIDSEVYPELYARLASLTRAPAREEKLRQLAASGLLWELARLHGPALADLVSAWPTATSSGEGDIVADRDGGQAALLGMADEPPAPVPFARSPDGDDRAPADAGVPEGDAAMPARSARRREPAPDFVDLALDVPQDGRLDVPLDVDVGTAPATAPPAPPDVPVLVDEVPPSLLHEVPAVTVAMVVPLHDEAAPTDTPDAGGRRDPVVRRPASRERLKRMRDRGLFQNG